MPLLIVLLLLALVFGIGAVVKGILWLALIGFVLFVVLVAVVTRALRGAR